MTIDRLANAKVGLIGFLAGRGHSPAAIAGLLSDGTAEHTIRRLLWAGGERRPAGIAVRPFLARLTSRQRQLLARRARAVGITPEDWLALVVAAAADKNLYANIIDGREFPVERDLAEANPDADPAVRS